MNDLVKDMEWAINCCSDEHDLLSRAIPEFKRLAEENKKLKDALRKIGKTGPEKIWSLYGYELTGELAACYVEMKGEAFATLLELNAL